MKPSLAGGVLATVLLTTLLTIYQTKQALVVRPGKPVRVITEPGLNAKIPFIDSVIYRRLDQASRPSRPIAGPCDFEPAWCAPFASPLFVSHNNADTLASRTLAMTLCDGSPPKPIFGLSQNFDTATRLSATSKGCRGPRFRESRFGEFDEFETNRENLATFHRGLDETGYIEGKNVRIEYRWAQGRNDELPTLAAELVQHQVSVIAVLESTNGALAAKAATQTIPIVFMQGANPVQIGLVDSLNRPGGNLTGISLLLLLELVPKATSIGYLRNPTNPVYAESETRKVDIVARAHGVRLLIVNASRPSEIETAFAEPVQQRPDALQVSSDGFLLTYPDQIVALAARYAVPAIYAWPKFAAY